MFQRALGFESGPLGCPLCWVARQRVERDVETAAAWVAWSSTRAERSEALKALADASNRARFHWLLVDKSGRCLHFGNADD